MLLNISCEIYKLLLNFILRTSDLYQFSCIISGNLSVTAWLEASQHTECSTRHIS